MLTSKHALRRILALMLSIALSVTMLPATVLPVAFAAESAEEEILLGSSDDIFADVEEPKENPDYLRWLNGEDFGGLIPEQYLNEREPNNRRVLRAATGDRLYDPRTESSNSLTPVKNQGSVGACWAFASVALLESYIKHTFSSVTDFSEQHMRYALSTDGGNTLGFDRTNEDGGNTSMSAAYYMRSNIGGPVLEFQDPYVNSAAVRAASITESKPRTGKATHMFTLKDLSSGSPGSETSKQYMGEIKKLIIDYGAASISYNSDQTTATNGTEGGYKVISGTGTNYDGECSYFTTTTSTNHAVTAV
ncbi:MAG: hypothetical protein LBC41_17260 [Clostridiales bacterium]|jgi:C1A family cysteine protease|nr:hypothetical protein [Clostridiales bacterium]